MFGKTKKELEIEAREIQEQLNSITAQENTIAKAKADKKHKKDRELAQYKNLNFDFGIGQPLSWRLAKFYVIIARDNVRGLEQFNGLAAKMNLTAYFAKLDKENQDSVTKCPEYDSNDNRVN